MVQFYSNMRIYLIFPFNLKFRPDELFIIAKIMLTIVNYYAFKNNLFYLFLFFNKYCLLPALIFIFIKSFKRKITK